MADWLQWLADLPPAALLRRSATLYMLLNAAHILSIGLLVGAILPLDLRLMGVVRDGPLAVLAPFLSRCAAFGLALAIATGFCLFAVKPVEYAQNPAFLAKLGLLCLAIFNVLAMHATEGWRTVRSAGRATTTTRLLAALSFSVWIAAVIAGRWIGFV